MDGFDDYLGTGSCTCPNQLVRDKIIHDLRSQGFHQVYHQPHERMTFFVRETLDPSNPSKVQYFVEYKGR